MASVSDITLMLTTDGKEWDDYISDELKHTDRNVTHASLVLDADQEYENPEEVLRACRQSAAVVLLATQQLLNYMHDEAVSFCKALQEVPDTSSLIVVLLVDKKNVDDVTNDSYVTSRWIYLEPGISGEETEQMINRVYQLARQKAENGTREKTVSTIQKTPPATVRPPPYPRVDCYPSTIYESDVPVALVFEEEIKGDVSLKIGQAGLLMNTTRKSATTFTFLAPQLAAGRHRVQVFVDNKHKYRSELNVREVEMTAFTSCYYLRQTLGLCDLHELDLYLKKTFDNSLPDGKARQIVFQNLPPVHETELQNNSNTLYPTLLHFAAAHGLEEFCAALLECPNSTLATHIRNSDGRDPAELAKLNGFQELANKITDSMNVQTPIEEEDHYVDMRFPSVENKGVSEDLYENMEQLRSTPTRVISAPPPLVSVTAPDLPPRRAKSSELPPKAGRADRSPMATPRRRSKATLFVFKLICAIFRWY